MKKNSKQKTAMLYASAMYEAGIKENQLPELLKNAQKMEALLFEGIEDFNYLNNPLWNIEHKENIIETISQKLNFCSTMINTLKLLALNSRLNDLADILQNFIKIYNQNNNITEIEVETVIALNDIQEAKLNEKLTKIFKTNIIIKYVINPEIIGGLIIKSGTVLIDNSIKNKLKRLENILKGTK